VASCHDLFPMLSPINHIHAVSFRLMPHLPFPMLQAALINPDHTQLYPMGLFLLVHGKEPEPSSEHTPSASGMQQASNITWTSCDDCATMHYPCHLISRPLSQWTWDLRVPTLFIFQSISILLHADASLIAPQCLYVYLFLILTRRPIVCSPVPCLHPSLLYPHAVSCPTVCFTQIQQVKNHRI